MEKVRDLSAVLSAIGLWKYGQRSRFVSLYVLWLLAGILFGLGAARAEKAPGCDDALAKLPAPGVTLESTQSKEGYDLTPLHFQSSLPSGNAVNDTVHGDLYLPKTPGPHPAVVVLHNLLAMANARFERGMAASLAQSGYVAVFMDLPFHRRRTPPGSSDGALFVRSDLRLTVENVKQAAADASSLVRWLSERPDVDPKRIGMVGVSIGGFITHLVMGQNSRVKSGVTFVAGGDVAGLLWKSNAGVARTVKRRLESRGINREEAARRLAEVEPTRYADCNAPRSVLMVNATDDLIVPHSSADAMADALGHPPQLWLPTNHFGIALLPDRLYHLARDFLDAELNGKKFPVTRLRRYEIPSVSVGAFSGLQSRLTAGMEVGWPVLFTRNNYPIVLLNGLWTGRGGFAGASFPLNPFLSFGAAWRLAQWRRSPSLYASLNLTL
jgi:dienelactone hydrolase